MNLLNKKKMKNGICFKPKECNPTDRDYLTLSNSTTLPSIKDKAKIIANMKKRFKILRQRVQNIIMMVFLILLVALKIEWSL